jgi:hypothetical protein
VPRWNILEGFVPIDLPVIAEISLFDFRQAAREAFVVITRG